MRILYDGRIYFVQKAGGINRYFANVIANLPETVHPVLTLKQSRVGRLPTHPNLKIIDRSFRFRPGRLSGWLENAYYEFISNSKKFDAAHPTYYSLLTWRDVRDYTCPVVVTVYDMIHELFAAQPEHSYLDPSGREVEIKRRAILAADAVICISESTKRDLVRLLPVPEHKISVTYLASELHADLSFGSEKTPQQPYFIYVGGRSRYKNFMGLLHAFARVAATLPEVILCVVGSAFSDEEQKVVSALHIADRVYHAGYADDTHLAKLYRCSLALVYPSLYEGFGIPPLEAMSCGTLVIAANTSSIPEVVGDSGILFDPNAEDELADVLRDVAKNKINRQEYLQRGLERSEQFTWKKTADQTYDVYRSVCE